MAETLLPREPVAVIDIGSSAIRLVVAEVGAKSASHYLENLQKPVPLGKDVFKTGRISNPVMRQAIGILEAFKSVIDTYGVKRMHAIATNAVREAANRETFIDQVFVRTGIDVEVIEGAEENRLDLIAVEHALAGRFEFDKKSCLIMEVGTGSTELILTLKGEVILTRTISIGPIRLPEMAQATQTDPSNLQRIIRRNVHSIADEIRRDHNMADIDNVITLGAHMRFICKHLREKVDEPLGMMSTKEFSDFVRGVAKMNAEDIAEQYGLSYIDAETFYASLLLYESFIGQTKADQILVPMVSIRDGLLIEMAQLLSGHKRTDLSRQVVNAARSLGRKYKYDEPHAQVVTQLALKLFDQLKADHGLGSRERLLLEVSALVHEIGMFVATSSHHKHGSYLVRAAEIFGLRKTDKDIVANVVRYHRRSPPQPTHVEYASLPRVDRAIVSKLASILRVACALDKSHQQRIRDFVLERQDDTYTLWISEDLNDISMERESLAKKGAMFTDVLGATLVLKQGNPSKP